MWHALWRSLALVTLMVFTGPRGYAAAPLRPLVLGVGGAGQIGYLPLTLADRLGYYRDEGLAVEIDNFQGGTKSVEALIGGSIDVVGGAYDNTLILQAKGITLTTVFTFVDHYGYVLGMAPARAAAYRTPQDLKGLKIGVGAPGSSMENLVRIVLRKAGLGIDDVAAIGVGTGAAAVAALVSGQVDAIVLGEPEVTRTIIDHVFVPLVDTRKAEGMDDVYGGPAAGAGALMTASFIKAHPDLVQAYVNALYRAHRWLRGARPAEVAAVVPKSYWGGDEKVYEAALDEARSSLTPDGRTTQQKASATYHSMLRAGRLPDSFKVDFASSFDDRFVTQAIGRFAPSSP